MNNPSQIRIKALKVRQWLPDWDDVIFSIDEHRRKPQDHFYIFSIPANQLKKLSKVYHRVANRPRSEDMSIQRSLDQTRINEISRFIYGGFPWSDLSDRMKEDNDYKDLKMPGWLPTAIVANILPENSFRNDLQIEPNDVIKIEHIDSQTAEIVLPNGILEKDWNPLVPPIEIIDGQHRLYSFLENKSTDDFHLPVVAFFDLDFTWQAYLFYTINIKPKKINTSLAFDLYPLLRIQDWLEKSSEGPVIYRETRSQELTEYLWSHPLSPWKERINMLGEKKSGAVTQAAFIRALLSSYVKRGGAIGGLFGSELHNKKVDILRWSRLKQAAFLIFVWRKIRQGINQSNEPWAEYLRTIEKGNHTEINNNIDPAFEGEFSLLATDQGVRGILQITNDMCFIASEKINLKKWGFDNDENEVDATLVIQNAIDSLENEPVANFLLSIAEEISKFDWRKSSTPNLLDDERRAQMIFKGSSGYKELRSQLIDLLTRSDLPLIFDTAKEVKNLLRY